MDKIRGFEMVEDWARKNNSNIPLMPERKTHFSAGYDILLPEPLMIDPYESVKIFLDIKAYMLNDEVLFIFPRSSTAIKKETIVKNIVGVVDSDYYNNLDNDGNIGMFLRNTGRKVQQFKKGEAVAQGIFMKYLISDNCNFYNERIGGLGSTN